ncbi:hypothetical protein PACTADRAFT_77044 [Pachysolen tannophilus NRRL Y-2460]|uniref:LSM complex subunit LSM3 n=1 Tax=Pachysolen tannophilus NRRL Y-2460 TaxID=669874 RepID=A0A1E4TRT7_PACTA|nr:hypothetical protein PACTADRAFT_77044 [Pachysolen tannophilus NRRL Y-2460]
MTEKSVYEPFSLIKLSLDEQVYIKLRGAREMVGKLLGYDSHCNMVLSDATETIFVVDEENSEPKTITKKSETIFIRGDSVILVSNAQD